MPGIMVVLTSAEFDPFCGQQACFECGHCDRHVRVRYVFFLNGKLLSLWTTSEDVSLRIPTVHSRMSGLTLATECVSPGA